MKRHSLSREQAGSFHFENDIARRSMTISVDDEFFIKASTALGDPRCRSLGLSAELRNAAAKKNGKPHDRSNENLLFPPSIIRKTLTPDKVKGILGCGCILCSSVRGRDLLTDDILTDAITTEDGDDQRRLFALLVFIGAGFAARHVCSFHTRGWDITTREASIRTQLFEPLEQSPNGISSSSAAPGIFQSAAQTTFNFIHIFKKTWPLFATPKMRVGNHVTNLSGENLPFLNEHPLNGDKSSFGSMFSFEIHPEFRGENIPAKAVRKEIPFNETTEEERRILEFLARCGKPNFVRLLFWYKYDNKVNYVFPHYPGSLHQLLEGKLDGHINPTVPGKYRTILQHYLWQGMVDVAAAMKFFHFPDQTVLPGQMIAAHFDLKPMNILVEENGSLIVTDFGQARIRQFSSVGETSLTAQVGDPNYRPPPASPYRRPVGASAGPSQDSSRVIGLRWSRAYDVWSLACIMTEVIEYIKQGPNGFRQFRERRFREDQSSAAFWKASRGGGYELKASVQEAFNRFRSGHDQYLDMVTDMLESMFSIDPLQRPPMADCLAIISEDIPTDEWPLKDDDEISICGLGTNPQLRNMHTQFLRKSERSPRRCKMYLLSTTCGDRIRLAFDFEKDMINGTSGSKISCVLSDSARREEEEYKPLSLFDAGHKPESGKPLYCSFGIVHPNLHFSFDEAQRGADEYYHFLTAVTRQRSLRLKPQIHMPISKCTIKVPTTFAGSRRETFAEGHVQIWRELTDDEYMEEFTYTPSASRRISVISPLSPVTSRSRQNSEFSTAGSMTGSNSSGSSGPTVRSPRQVRTRRLVVFLPGAPSRLLTINLTNKFNKPRLERNSDGHQSPSHVTFTAVSGSFFIGNFLSTGGGCPGIPLDPDVFASKENFRVAEVELEFQDDTAMKGFRTLWDLLYPRQ